MATSRKVNAQKIVDKEVKFQLQERSDKERFFQRELDYVEKNIAARSVGGFVALGGICGLLAGHFGSLGCEAILRGDANGWKQVHRGATYLRWKIKICRMPYEKPAAFTGFGGSHFLRTNERHAACMACYGVATELDDVRDEALKTLTGIPHWPNSVDPKHWSRRIFEPFVVVLLKQALREAVPSEFATRDLGVYSQVIEAWDDPTKLGNALVNLCDYHCQQMDGDIFKWYPEFQYPPFKLVPVEILAIRKLREQLGLATPEVKHPLLELPTASMPLPDLEDTQPDEIINRIRQAYPELLDGE